MNTSPTGRVEAVQRKALNALSYVIYLVSRDVNVFRFWYPTR